MARLVGVDLPREKRVEIALTYIFGIGLTRAHATLAATGVNPDTRVKDLQEPELAKLREFIEANYKLKETFAVKSQATFAVRLKFKVTKAFATARDFLFVVNARIQMRVHAKALVRQSLVRRRRPSNGRR